MHSEGQGARVSARLRRAALFTPWAPLLFFITLATAYSLVVPVFEAPDEPAHFAYLNALLTSHQLPTHRETPQAHQPPAYYALLALFLHRPVHDGLEVVAEPNPEFRWNGPQKNLFLHSDQPWFSKGPRRVFFHQLRVLQLLLGTVPVLFAWKLARLVAPGDPLLAWLTGFLAAGIPQFLFISSSLSNANFTNAVSAAALYAIFRLYRQPEPQLRWAAAVGGLIGAGLLGKLTAAFLVPTYLTACAVSKLPRKQKVLHAATGLTAAMAVCAWFYAWNVARFGTVVGERNMFSAGHIHKVFEFGYWYFLFRSFWGRFGWLNVKAPLAVYLFFILLALAALAGLALHFRQNRRATAPPFTGLAMTAIVFLLFSIPPFTLKHDAFFQPQGRYLFPSLAAICLLMALGLRTLFRGRWSQPVCRWGLPAALLAANLLVLTFSIYPAYYG